MFLPLSATHLSIIWCASLGPEGRHLTLLGEVRVSHLSHLSCTLVKYWNYLLLKTFQRLPPGLFRTLFPVGWQQLLP